MENYLAIIIPYYKLRFFRETLNSLVNQTDQRFVVYIGDDASPENPEDLLKEFEGKFNFIYKRFDKNLGGTSLTRQWERCIEMSSGEEWIMVLGDDDCLSPDVVKKFFRCLKEIDLKKINVVSLDYQQINEEGIVKIACVNRNRSEEAAEAFCAKIKGKRYTSLSQYFFRRTIYLHKKFVHIPLAWGSDDLAVLEFAGNKRIFNLPEKVMVRISEKSISGNKTLQQEKTAALLMMYRMLFKKKILEKKRHASIGADVYFDLVLEDGKLREFVLFLNYVTLQIPLRKWLYFIKAYLYKSIINKKNA